MSKSIKLKNNNYWDSTSIVHKRKRVSELLDIPEGILLAENTNGHQNQYVKLFSIDFNNNQYKTVMTSFQISTTQNSIYNSTFELIANKTSNSDGIGDVFFEEKTAKANGYAIAKNLVAVRENSSKISIYYKILTNYETIKLKMLSCEKSSDDIAVEIATANRYLDELPSGTQYSCKPYDTGWVRCTIGSDFKAYNDIDENTPCVRRIGNIVQAKGMLSPRTNLSLPDSGKVLFNLPTGFSIPSGMSDFYHLCQGSLKNIWLLRVGSAGKVYMSRYGSSDYANAPAGCWLPFSFSYISE